MVFSNKKKLGNSTTRIGITENLTKSRYALYRKCIDKFGLKKVWTFDNRVNCIVDDSDTKKVFTSMAEFDNFINVN